MRVSFYGKLASTMGAQLDVPVEAPCSVGGLRRYLAASYPEAADALQDSRAKALVGVAFVAEDHALSPEDEVEFLAPLSGG